jgi:ABC-type lipoprotein release transport system permease subunit
MFIKLAWRNIFRNKRRTLIAGTAIGIGLAALIFVDALIIGMEKNMIRSATSSFLGEAQIHHKEFRKTREPKFTIENLQSVRTGLNDEEIVQAYSSRVLTMGMITSPSGVHSIQLVGIEPTKEPPLSQIDETIEEGDYLENENTRDLLIGIELADILEVTLGDRVVITVSEANTGILVQEMFRLSGIYSFNIPEMDQGMAFIDIKKAQDMLALGNGVHEIAVKFTDTALARDRDLPFWHEYSKYGNEAASWTKILPQLEAATELSQFSVLITAVILFGIVSLGIINTLFMSIHERMFEFGVLRAVGTRSLSVGRLIFFEAGSLAMLSVLLGILLGFGITYIISLVGIDYTGIEFAGVTFRKLLYPELKWYQFVVYPIGVFLFTLLVGLYPAVFAARMSPAKAMRKSF